MIDKICTFLTNKIRQEMPEIDDEKAEVINYGLQNIIGEFPKLIIMLIVAYILGIFPLALFTFLVLLPYRGVVGGVHLHSKAALRQHLYISGGCRSGAAWSKDAEAVDAAAGGKLHCARISGHQQGGRDPHFRPA